MVRLDGLSEIHSALFQVNDPLPVDGDSVYFKDLNLDLCDEGDFVIPTESGADKNRILASLVSDIVIAKVNDTVTNPKQLTLAFKRPITTSSFGINSGPGGTFSNTKVTLFQGEYSMTLVDESTDDTNQQIRIFPIPPVKFSKLLIEFYTADEISIGFIGVFKNIETASRIQAINDDGDVVNMTATNSGNLRTTNAEDGLAIAKGDVLSHDFVHKFGNTPDFDTGDGTVTIWDGANDGGIDQMQYLYSTTADIDSLSSSNNGDTQDVEIQGLDTDYNLVTQTITLTGQTRAALSTSLLRVFRMKNIGTTDVAGDVYCYVNTTLTDGVPDDSTKVRAVIRAGLNQTLMAIYTIPAGYTGYMRDWYASTAGASRNASYPIKLFARPFSQVFQIKHLSAISDTANSSIQHKYEEPEPFTEKTDIEMRAEIANPAITGASISAGFDIVLVEN